MSENRRIFGSFFDEIVKAEIQNYRKKKGTRKGPFKIIRKECRKSGETHQLIK